MSKDTVDAMIDAFAQKPRNTSIQKPLIYIACPYSLYSDKEIPFNAVTYTAAELLLAGNIIYSPITHTHPMATSRGLPEHFDFYQELDEFYLNRSDILAILTIEHWEDSRGIAHEMQLAQGLNKPIIYLPDPSARRKGDKNGIHS